MQYTRNHHSYLYSLFLCWYFFPSNLFIYLQQPLRRLCALHFGITGNINSLKQSCFLVWRHTILSTLPYIHVIVIQLSAASVRHETRILLAASRVKPAKFHLTWDRLHVLLGCTIDDASLIHSDANRNSHYTCMANGQLAGLFLMNIPPHWPRRLLYVCLLVAIFVYIHDCYTVSLEGPDQVIQIGCE